MIEARNSFLFHGHSPWLPVFNNTEAAGRRDFPLACCFARLSLRECGRSAATINRWENRRTEPNKMTLFVIRDFCKSKNIAFAFDTSKSVERGEQN
mgnify:CR=1 FL=1